MEIHRKRFKAKSTFAGFDLKDLYGPQSLIKNAIIPAELVFDNSGFFIALF